MREIPLKSWEDFESALSLYDEILQKQSQQSSFHFSDQLFRGQCNSSWKLENTLVRLGLNPFPMNDYYNIMRAIKPAVISLIEKIWELPDEYKDDESKLGPPLGYNFMVHLRHNGFPSPLLDWTRSPYIAAFFAFRQADIKEEETVAIYSFVEWIGKAKAWSGSKAHIVGLGPYVISHKRHFIQQCEYTICKKQIDADFSYCSHEEFIAEKYEGQDELIKYTLPVSERTKVLEKLHFMNINAFSLFGSEEGLMDTLSYNEIERKYLNPS